MKKSNLIIGAFLFTCYSSSLALAQDVAQPTTEQPEVAPINLTVEESEAIKKETKDVIANTVKHSDERDRKRLMNVIEDMKRRMHKKSNLNLSPEERKKYRSRRVNYKNPEDFNKYLNSFFMNDLDKINPQPLQETIKQNAPETKK